MGCQVTNSTKHVAPLFYFSIAVAAGLSYIFDKKLFYILLLALISAIFLYVYEKIHLYVFITMIGSKVRPVNIILLVLIAIISLLISVFTYFSSYRITESGSMLGIAIYVVHAIIRKSALRQVV